MVRFKLVSCKRFNNSTGLKIPWLANAIDLATHSSKDNDIDKCKILEKRTRGRRYSPSNTEKDDDIDSCKILEKTDFSPNILHRLSALICDIVHSRYNS